MTTRDEMPAQDRIEVRLARAMGHAPVAVQVEVAQAYEDGTTRVIGFQNVPIRPLMEEAADEIERLRRALDEAQARAQRAEEALADLADCQPLPKVYKYTGTAGVDVESMFDVGHRHRNGKQPRDYLMSWLSMFRPFAYATKDDSWGELEKLISITMNNYVEILVKAEKARAAQTLKDRNDG